jgi:hypothetical protein
MSSSVHLINLFIERMRRYTTQNNGHPGGASEFHLDVPQMPMWQNGSIPPSMHVQLVPTNMNGVDHLMNNVGDQIERKYFIYKSNLSFISAFFRIRLSS